MSNKDHSANSTQSSENDFVWEIITEFFASSGEDINMEGCDMIQNATCAENPNEHTTQQDLNSSHVDGMQYNLSWSVLTTLLLFLCLKYFKLFLSS